GNLERGLRVRTGLLGVGRGTCLLSCPPCDAAWPAPSTNTSSTSLTSATWLSSPQGSSCCSSVHPLPPGASAGRRTCRRGAACTCCWDGHAHRRQEQFQRNPDSYNGAVRENYTWSQDYTDLELKVPVPKHVVKGKQVSVTLSSTSIRVAVLEENGERVLMEGKFTHKINTESSLWSLEPGKCVLVSLNKVGEYWWSAILEGEEQIDIDKINKERSMATVDEEEHAVLDRLTFDYHQKLQGKPQSHELKVHEMLKKGWDAEGSPFRGQRFDPAMFNISPGAVQF
ncbi:hypothetical protein FD755_012430, partial [Muntiacus reevesi]